MSQEVLDTNSAAGTSPEPSVNAEETKAPSCSTLEQREVSNTDTTRESSKENRQPRAVELREEIHQLETRRIALESQKRILEGDRIKRLHTYNELKDTTQTLLGKLAELEGVSTKSLYPRFDLELED